MKKTGIVGGIGPASTLDYYSEIISRYRALTGSDKYPPIVIDSIDMTEMCGYVADKNYSAVTAMLSASVGNLRAAGADFALIASNTPHVVYNEIAAASEIPVISIVEESCLFAAEKGFKRVVVIGTSFTMNSSFYSDSFAKHGIETFMPDEADKNSIMNIIFPNLENGIVLPEDKAKMLRIAEDNVRKFNADALVLGCTEIPLMIKPQDTEIPLVNTTDIHINAAVRRLLSDD